MNKHEGFPYSFASDACATCGGKCCRGFSGYIWLSMEELERMAAARGMEAAVFARQYIRQVKGRLSLREHILNGEHFCCFFDRIDCRCLIYATRPKQCRTFPFWERFKIQYEELALECPGVVLATKATKKA